MIGSPRRDRDDGFAQGGIRSIGTPVGATSMPRWMWGRLARNRGYEKIVAKSTDEGGQGRGHVVHDPGKEDDWSTQTVSGGCTLSHGTVWKNKHRTPMWKGGANHLNQYHFREFLRKAGSGDWANLSGGCDRTADVGSTTLSKSFLKWSSTVSCSRYHAPQPDGLRTARRPDNGSGRSVGICFYLDELRTNANLWLKSHGPVCAARRKSHRAIPARLVAERRFGCGTLTGARTLPAGRFYLSFCHHHG